MQRFYETPRIIATDLKPQKLLFVQPSLIIIFDSSTNNGSVLGSGRGTDRNWPKLFSLLLVMPLRGWRMP